MNVIIYVRVSSLRQDYSYQLTEIKDYCNRCNYKIVDVYEEKMSGTKDERPEFQKLLKLTKDDCDAIVMYKLDRLGRKLSTVIKAVELFTEKGINVISLKENFIALDFKTLKLTMASMITLSVLSTMAQCERESIIERTADGKYNKLINEELPYTDKPPFGYSIIDNKLVIDEKEAELVKKIFNDYLNGFGQNEIAKAYGVHQSFVSRILKNSVYMGKPYSNVLKRTLTAPSIIEEEVFLRARHKCEEKTIVKAKRAKDNNEWKGLLFCPLCGGMLSLKGKSWGCHCYRTSIQDKFVMKATLKVLAKFAGEIVERTARENNVEINIRTKEEQIKTIENILLDLQASFADRVAKYEALKEVFPLETLKREVAEMKRIKRDIEKYEGELSLQKEAYNNLIQLTQKAKNKNKIAIKDYISKIIVNIVDRANKRLDFYTLTDEVISVQVRTRKNEYTFL